MNPLTYKLLDVLSDLDDECLRNTYRLVPECGDAPLDGALFAWRDAGCPDSTNAEPMKDDLPLVRRRGWMSPSNLDDMDEEQLQDFMNGERYETSRFSAVWLQDRDARHGWEAHGPTPMREPLKDRMGRYRRWKTPEAAMAAVEQKWERP